MTRWLGAAAAALLLTAGLVIGTRAPWVVEPEDAAVVRLTWRALGEHRQECRAPTAEELARLPAHMRPSEICERTLRPFRLAVAIDGHPRFDGFVHASGAREDRPTYVFRDFRVPPGAHRLRVRFAVDAPPGSDAPPALVLDETVELAVREILIVGRTAPEEGGGLRVLAPRQP